MLKTKIEHFFSTQEKHSLELVKLSLDTTDLDEKEALDNGWLLSANRWYQCRSVRLDLTKFSIEHLNFEVEFLKERPGYIFDIYNAYIEYKGYKHIPDLAYEDDRTEYLVLKDDGRPVAFTKFQRYLGGLESQLNAWNYHKPKLGLGRKMINYEADYAISLGLSHLYIGEGCELGSIYKADLPGFEWWTGSEWSVDKEKYKSLCVRDSSIKTLYELSDIFNG